MKNIRVLGSNVLVDPKGKESKTAGGLYIPEVSQAKIPEGVVTIIGPDVKDVAVGDVVMLDTKGETIKEIKLEDKEYFILDEGDILGVLTV